MQWETLLSTERQIKKIELIVEHPSERTQTAVRALLTHTSPEEGSRSIEEDTTRASALLCTVKAVIKRQVFRARLLGTALPGNEYITELPTTVAELPQNVWQHLFHSIAPYDPPIDLNLVWRSATQHLQPLLFSATVLN